MLQRYLETIKNELLSFLANLDRDNLKRAADIIAAAKNTNNRLHFSGIGKPSYVAAYAASLCSSTGTPAYVLHGTEAVHGSAGQIVAGDVVVCISNSGETSELLATAKAVLNNGGVIIAITSNPNSSLARLAEVHLLAKVEKEGGPLNRAPRASVLAELIVVQALSILLQEQAELDLEGYLRRHPGGSLGQTGDCDL